MTLQDLDTRHLVAMVQAGYAYGARLHHTEDLTTEREDFDLYSAWLGAGSHPVTSHGRKP